MTVLHGPKIKQPLKIEREREREGEMEPESVEWERDMVVPK